MERARWSTRLTRALRLRCPVCGSGGVISGWVHLAERCPRCTYRFERVEGQWIGYIGLNTIVTFVGLFVVLVAGFVVTYPDIAVVPLLIVGIGYAVAFPVFFLPFSRTLWTVIDLAMRPLEPGEALPPWGPTAN